MAYTSKLSRSVILEDATAYDSAEWCVSYFVRVWLSHVDLLYLRIIW